MIKPDGVQRGLIGDIFQRFEKKGFKLVAMKFMQVGRYYCLAFRVFSELCKIGKKANVLIFHKFQKKSVNWVNLLKKLLIFGKNSWQI